MNTKFVFKLLLIISLSHSTALFAAETLATKNEDFRCEKLTGTKLTEFKAALIENCNLNKPFSSSLSRVLNEDTYFYCCHLK